jgi:hypothetical protein
MHDVIAGINRADEVAGRTHVLITAPFVTPLAVRPANSVVARR